ncbi:MAG: HD domain-containing protein [Casimicrobium sp.]
MPLAPAFSSFVARLGLLVEADRSRLSAAWDLAVLSHDGQIRQSGEPYVLHPLAVAEILFEQLNPGVDALCAALLHDVVEDGGVSVKTIRGSFGDSVAHIVDGVSKLGVVEPGGEPGSKDGTLRKLVVAGGRDWRVFAVKLCDRLHNMRTLGSVNQDKRVRVARETYQIFFPLARYVGFQSIAVELEALCLQALHPWRWRVVCDWVIYRQKFDSRRAWRLLAVGESAQHIFNSSESYDRPFELSVRAFHQIRHDRSFRVLFSMPAKFVRYASMQGAYDAICLLHKFFVVIPAGFSSDASDGYVTTKVLLSQTGPVFELIARHPAVDRGAWVRAIGDAAGADDFAVLATGASRAGEFTRVLRELLDDKAIAVFTPKGRRVTLPKRACGIDFAFAIHTDVGLRAKAIRINGVMRDVTTELMSGDFVDVILADGVVARPEWESFLRSPRSRAKLRHWARGDARGHAVALGRRMVGAALGLSEESVSTGSSHEDFALSELSVPEFEVMLQRVGEGSMSAQSVAISLPELSAQAILNLTDKVSRQPGVTLDGIDGGRVRYCAFCMPLPGDDVVCTLSPLGALAHRVECSLCAGVGQGVGYLLDAGWSEKIHCQLPAQVSISSLDRKGLLVDCASSITAAGIDITAVHSRTEVTLGKAIARLDFSVLVSTASELAECVNALALVSGVISAERRGCA